MSQELPNDWLHQLTTEAPDAILCCDREGIIRFWNRGAEMLFGVPAAAAVGASLDLIIPERQRPRHWQGYRQVMESGVTRYGTELLGVPALHADGRRLSVEFSIVMLRDAEGRPEGVAEIMRDISVRREREKALAERLAALEAAGGGAAPSAVE